MDNFSSNLVDFSDSVGQLSDSGVVGSVFAFLASAGDWADAVAKLIGLVA
ncbi:MAG: PorA family porin [Corynebacterium sp.]|nr:PorA family porin [Corynebacterium sp.]MDO5669380.1 PorA family porin [Corynebacterium sp.]